MLENTLPWRLASARRTFPSPPLSQTGMASSHWPPSIAQFSPAEVFIPHRALDQVSRRGCYCQGVRTPNLRSGRSMPDHCSPRRGTPSLHWGPSAVPVRCVVRYFGLHPRGTLVRPNRRRFLDPCLQVLNPDSKPPSSHHRRLTSSTATGNSERFERQETGAYHRIDQELRRLCRST